MRRTIGATVVILGWSLLGAHASGCGSSDSNTPAAADAAADTATHACTAGQSVACTGPGGCSGGQVCKSDSSGFDTCICGGPGGDAGSDAANDSSVEIGRAHV